MEVLGRVLQRIEPFLLESLHVALPLAVIRLELLGPLDSVLHSHRQEDRCPNEFV